MNNAITTASGHTFDAANPNPTDVRIDDVAHALGNLCRFTGHTSRFYSVLEHSLLCLDLARGRWRDDAPFRAERELAVLLHDAHEAYLNDVSTPVRGLIGPDYQRLVRCYDHAIAHAAGLDPWWLHCDLVHDCDALALKIEAWNLLQDRGITGGINPPTEPQPYDFIVGKACAPDVGVLRSRFISEYLNLKGDIDG